MGTCDEKTDPTASSDELVEAEEIRLERIRKAVFERHRKADTDGTRRRARQTVEDNRLI
jgi:hypothetical protein